MYGETPHLLLVRRRLELINLIAMFVTFCIDNVVILSGYTVKNIELLIQISNKIIDNYRLNPIFLQALKKNLKTALTFSKFK